MSRAIYYPGLSLTLSESRFGALESNNPTLYEMPIPNVKIYRFDTLECVKEIWGNNILMSRNVTYKLISGSCDDVTYHKILKSYYKKFAGFSYYMNDKIIFADEESLCMKNIITPIRSVIDEYALKILGEMKSKDVKFLMRTHDFIYGSVPASITLDIPYSEVKIIC